MQLTEFIEATNTFEQYYGKELTTEQMQIMYDELKDFSIERYKKIISKCLKTCKYMPRIADIISANMEITEIQEEKKTFYNCDICNGSGFIKFTRIVQDGNRTLKYDCFNRCICKNGNYYSQKIPTFEQVGIKPGEEIFEKIN